MKVLVTGATGFIGRSVVAHLAQGGRFEVVTTSRMRLPEPITDVIHQPADLLNFGAAAELVAKVRPTHLLHLAWNATPGRFWNAPDNLDWAAASLGLLSAFLAQGGRRAVMAGSCAEYDWTGGGCLTELSPARPATFYGTMKHAVGQMACAANDHLGASIAWGRVFWLYGPGEASGRLVSDVASDLAAERPAKVGDGSAVRDFLHVDDVASAFVAALSHDWRGPFNIGSGEGVSIRDVVGLLGEAAKRPDLLRFGARPTSAGEPPLLVADTTVLRREIGWRPSIPLKEGLASSYAWWCKGGAIP